MKWKFGGGVVLVTRFMFGIGKPCSGEPRSRRTRSCDRCARFEVDPFWPKRRCRTLYPGGAWGGLRRFGRTTSGVFRARRPLTDDQKVPPLIRRPLIAVYPRRQSLNSIR